MGCCQSHMFQTENIQPFQDCIIQFSSPSQISSQGSIKENILKNNKKNKQKYESICPEEIGLDNKKCNQLSFLKLPSQSQKFIKFFPQSGLTLRIIENDPNSKSKIDTSRSIREMNEVLNTMILKFQRVEGGYSKKLIQLENDNQEINLKQVQNMKRIKEQNKQNENILKIQDQSSCVSKLLPKIQQRQLAVPTISPIDLNIDLKMKNKPMALHSQVYKKNRRQSEDAQQSQDHSNSSYSQCLLTNPSRILNQSLIFTERQNQKNIFYSKYSQIQLNTDKYSLQKICLKDWKQMDRQGFTIDLQQILEKYQKNQNNLDSIFRVIMMAIGLYKKNHEINLISYLPQISVQKDYGLRIFLNGQKRLFCLNKIIKQNQSLNNQFQKLKINTLREVIQILHNPHQTNQNQQEQVFIQKNPSELIYNLTGWIPEEINLQQITNLQGVLQRLANNFNDGNTLITFTVLLNIQENKRQKQVKINFALKSIDSNEKTLILYGFILPQYEKHFQQSFLSQKNNGVGMKIIGNCQFQVHWQKLIQKVEVINVNWNISIYDFSYKFQSSFFQKQIHENSLIKKIDLQNINGCSTQYLLKIPPNQDDIELRLFLQTHHQYPVHINPFQNQPLILIQLYDYNGSRINTSLNPIRQLERSQSVWSDVLIFQASKQKNQYVLVVRPNQNVTEEQIFYTLNMFSFTQIILKQLPQQKILCQKTVQTCINPSHAGYGINSPFFLKNIHFSLKVPKDSDIKIFVQAPEEHKFELCLVGDSQGRKNITKINLQGILNDINCSQQIETAGYYDCVSKHQNNILILTSYTESKGPIKVLVQAIKKYTKSLIKPNNTEIIEKQLIQFEEISSFQKSIFSKQIKWFPTNTGPRKRLKSNTNSQFQQYSVFSQFFKNPYLDYKIDQTGIYQFSITSNTYKQIFNQTQTYEQKQDLQPITLSMGIFQIGENGKLFKIVMDDAFYVPFGFGFWSKQMLIQKGSYRFVFPKMQKDSGNGTFSVYRVG